MAALLLSSCGKQEAVGDVPSSEELAQQADAATAAIRDEAAGGNEGAAIDSIAMTSYANALRGFSIMVPEKWALDTAASDDNGNVYKDPENGATLTVGWIENREDTDFKAAVDAVEQGGDSVTGDDVSENEYRASGLSNDSSKMRQRIFRKPDGTMVRAMVRYPADQAEKLDGPTKQIIDSLTLQ